LREAREFVGTHALDFNTHLFHARDESVVRQ
jgi:hypothetical protein